MDRLAAIKVLLAIARCRTAALGGHIAARPHGSHALSLFGASDSALGFLANFVLADHRSTIIGRIAERLLFLDDKQPIHAKRCFHQVKPKEVVREG